MKTAVLRQGHRLLLAGALAFVAVVYASALVLSYFNSDLAMYGVFLRDVFEQGGIAEHFLWSGKSDLFPDFTTVFALYQLTGDPLRSEQLCATLIFVAYVAAAITLHRASGGRRTEAVAPVVALISVASITNLGVSTGFALNDMFVPTAHGGTQVMALVGLALVQRGAFSRRIGGAFWLTAAICVLMGVSDPLFAVIFTMPAGLMLLIWKVAARGRPQARLLWLVNIAISTAFGIWVGPHVVPYAVSDVGYAHVNVDAISAGIDGLFASLRPSNGGPFVVLFAVGTLSIPAAVLVLLHPPRAIGQLPGRDGLIRLLLFAALAFMINIGVVLLIGSFQQQLRSIRYFSFALVVPPMVIAMLVVEGIEWTAGAVRIAYVAASVIIVATTSQLPSISGYIQEARQLIPFLRDVMAREQIEDGLAEYWYANSLTFLSNNEVRLRAIGYSGAMLYWLNNPDWYMRKPNGEAVEFRLILVGPGIDRDSLIARYGRPDKVIPAPTSKQVWIYSPSHRIVYSAGGYLVNQHARPTELSSMRFAAVSLPSQTGRPADEGILATPANPPGYITYGPYVRPKSGWYQLTIAYVYVEKPAAGKEAIYDAVLWQPTGAEVIDAAPLEFTDRQPSELRREFSLDNPAADIFEVRTYYRGSGTIEIRSITISTVGQ